MSTESALVLYHHPCHDGIFAALAAHMHFRDRVGCFARFVPHKVYEALSEKALDLAKQDNVYLLVRSWTTNVYRSVRIVRDSCTKEQYYCRTTWDLQALCSGLGSWRAGEAVSLFIPQHVHTELDMPAHKTDPRVCIRAG